MQHQEFEPPGALKDTIKCFWYNKQDFGEQPSNFEVVPDGYAEIIFYFGTLCRFSTEGDLQPLPSPFLMGLLNQTVLFSTQNRLEIIGVRCFPWTVFDLLGLPSGSDGVRVFEHPIAQIQPALAEKIKTGTMLEALTLVEQYFLNARLESATDVLLLEAGAALRKANGTLPVSAVATAAHATVRTLERKFKKSSGHTVKDVSGLMRFEQVRNRLWQTPNTNLATLAQELGYTDQSHLSREFKRYSGTTPATFARKAQEKHAIRGDIVAFVQS